MAELDLLFNSGGLNDKQDFLNDKKLANTDGIYRIDLEKVKDKKKGWKSVIRLLPDLRQDGTIGQSAIEKVTHFVDMKNQRELSGWFDSPKNFGKEHKCALSDLYYTMINSKSAILIEKAKVLKYSKKYYSYCLVVEDEQQPELIGKIMIFQYGKQIKDKITAEKNGDITGESCNVFDLVSGKDLVLSVKETGLDDERYPDYNSSAFRPNNSSLPIYNEETGKFKNVTTSNGSIDSKLQGIVKDFLLKRDFELENFAPKKLTDEQESKIVGISNFLTGKTSSTKTVETSDFDFEEPAKTSAPVTSSDEDDFFN